MIEDAARERLTERLRADCADTRDRGSRLAVVLTAVDDFRSLNVQYEDAAGDRALVALRVRIEAAPGRRRTSAPCMTGTRSRSST